MVLALETPYYGSDVGSIMIEDLFVITESGSKRLNTLPLELQALQTNATTPVIYALGTLTTALSLGVIVCCLLVVLTIQHRRTRSGDPTAPGQTA
jgi:putative spermidine/putrescine transport system permease protein